ncbi:hypothetical protein M2152_002485 [Microbacteriaceae bacterium SG_E_30_P1]|uniref:Uncharacterized protein n=1 Tax=Antiquaquibacter oligotrophicus TaxID=2880260 RepID=A0ABT6KS32_9MICO|nr:hypothetical protein [Antiquaquibacter oligotrophicus]MDH6182303.1 hypothetical protein [Antiquaquibacter oligotrophicus]UDF12042.1 hypothetical protein LH407_07640 [Antiquaquibacter oligotrophicus]
MSSVNPEKQRLAWWQRLNRALFPFMGPAQLGPFGEEPLPSVAEKPCPLCGNAMSQHTFERSQDRTATRMHCPPAAN